MWQKLDTQSVYRDVGDLKKKKKKKKNKKKKKKKKKMKKSVKVQKMQISIDFIDQSVYIFTTLLVKTYII